MASIAFPESWGPEETDTGIQATSDDGAIYISIDVADGEGTDKAIDEVIAFLEKNGVSVDPATQKQSEDTLNGMKMANFDWSGKDKDGPSASACRSSRRSRTSCCSSPTGAPRASRKSTPRRSARSSTR